MSEERKRLIGNRVILFGKEGSITLEIELYFDQGSVSSRGVKRMRGYYLIVVPVIYDKRTDQRSYDVNAGVVKRIETAERFSPKKLKKIEPKQEDIDQLVAKVESNLKKQLIIK